MPPEPEPPELNLPVVPALAADQIAAHALTGARSHGPFHTHCENCGTPLAGPFCHHCGQHDFEFHRSFWHVFLEVLENFFHFDAKLFRNIFTLLFRPGRLTAEFNAGRRAAQMPPFRLYLFVSVLFFFLVFLGSGALDQVPLYVADEAAGQNAITGLPLTSSADDSPAIAGPSTAGDPRRDLQAELRAEAKAARAEAARSGQAQEIERGIEHFVRRLGDPAQRQVLVDHFLHSLPRMLLFCLPLFALYTRLLFRRSGKVYLQHLVLALHFHTFIYLWIMVRNGWGFLAGLPGWGLEAWLRGACNLWLYLYPFVMLRRLFANSWPRTILKTILLAGGYFLTLAGVMLAAAIFILTQL